MKRSRLRPRSRKFTKRARECQAGRAALVAEVGRCEICHVPLRLAVLNVHEIANGPNRQKALDKRYATLVTCWVCNSDKLTDKSEWPESRQLAALKRSRPRDYDLAAYNALVGKGPERITEDDVTQWLTK